MGKLNKFRERVNKNDGAFYQVDNQTLTLYEVIGYLLLIASLIIYLLHEKVNFEHTWLGWVFLFTSMPLVVIGASKRIRNDKNT